MNLNVLCNNEEQLYSAVSNDSVNGIIFEADISSGPDIDRCHAAGKKAGIALPYIYRNSTAVDVTGYDEVYVRSLDELEYYKDQKLVSDYGVYCMNPVAADVLKENGISRITAPVEMNCHELAGLDVHDKELIVYGHIPMMVSAQCVHRNTDKCDRKPGITWIKDRTGKLLPVENKCAYCYNLIYNPDPVSLAGVFDKVLRLNPDSVRINLTIENRKETERIIAVFSRAIRGESVDDPCDDFTRGHFLRGVE